MRPNKVKTNAGMLGIRQSVLNPTGWPWQEDARLPGHGSTVAVKLHLCWWHRLRQSLVSWHLWWIICCNHKNIHRSYNLIFLQGYPALALPNAVMNFFHEFRHKFPVPRNQGWNREHQNDESPMGRCLVAHHPSKRRQCLVGNTPNQDIPSKPWVLREVLKCFYLIKIPKMNSLSLIHNL